MKINQLIYEEIINRARFERFGSKIINDCVEGSFQDLAKVIDSSNEICNVEKLLQAAMEVMFELGFDEGKYE